MKTKVTKTVVINLPYSTSYLLTLQMTFHQHLEDHVHPPSYQRQQSKTSRNHNLQRNPCSCRALPISMKLPVPKGNNRRRKKSSTEYIVPTLSLRSCATESLMTTTSVRRPLAWFTDAFPSLHYYTKVRPGQLIVATERLWRYFTKAAFRRCFASSGKTATPTLIDKDNQH